jgi:60 kDa SS-A/Ro ribonucleoprotein
MKNAYTGFNPNQTPQSEPIPGRSDQVKNSAGGYVFSVDDWTRLDRFLILGTEGGTYYVGEHTLTRDNAEVVLRCLASDGKRTVERIAEISDSGRAPKNEPALFAMALALASNDTKTRQVAMDNLPRVARTGTHIFHLAQYVEQFRGWGPTLRKAVGGWYNSLTPEDLVYQAIKYQQRDGWSHRDLLRLAHVKPATSMHDQIFKWIAKGWDGVGDEPHPDEVLRRIWAFEKAKRATTRDEITLLITGYNLPREAIPTQWLNDPAVWERLFEKMPLTALIRNLGKMTSVGLFGPMGSFTAEAARRLSTPEYLQKGRVHPMAVLLALGTYLQGHGEKGKLTWDPVREIVDALDTAFYGTFSNVEPTGKRIMKALDVSGSMANQTVAGTPISARAAAAAFALITARVEPRWMVTIFSSAGVNFHSTGNRHYGDLDGLSEFPISTRERLDDIVSKTSGLPFGGTDCALPMLYAMHRKLEIDSFEIYTDNETWAGMIHPSQALQQYRRQMGIPAKLVVVGMTATGFSIADPNDAGMLDVVGLDTSTPALINDFIRG